VCCHMTSHDENHLVEFWTVLSDEFFLCILCVAAQGRVRPLGGFKFNIPGFKLNCYFMK